MDITLTQHVSVTSVKQTFVKTAKRTRNAPSTAFSTSQISGATTTNCVSGLRSNDRFFIVIAVDFINIYNNIIAVFC